MDGRRIARAAGMAAFWVVYVTVMAAVVMGVL